MAVKFDAGTAAVFRSCGWSVDQACQWAQLETRVENRTVIRQVSACGDWQVFIRNTGENLGFGQESHPALAGMQATECFLTYRDNQT